VVPENEFGFLRGLCRFAGGYFPESREARKKRERRDNLESCAPQL
jgi:hypothetical protein